MSLIAIKFFPERMLNDSTFSSFFDMLNVVQCVGPVTEHCSVRACALDDSEHEVQPCSAKCSERFSNQQLNITKQHSTLLKKC